MRKIYIEKKNIYIYVIQNSVSAGPDEMPESSQHCWSTENHVDTPPAEVTITLQEQVNNVRLAMLDESTRANGCYSPIYDPETMETSAKKKWCSNTFQNNLRYDDANQVPQACRNHHKN